MPPLRTPRSILLRLASICWLLLALPAAAPARVLAVESVGMTVSDLDEALAFYTKTLPFEKISEVEVHGDAYDRLQGVFALRIRVARLRLGDEYLELTEYLTPQGRPIPIDSRSNDLWFQHVAIIVSDMEKAYERLRGAGVNYVSPAPQRLPDWNPNAGGIKAFYFRDADGHNLEILWFPPGKGANKWQSKDKLFLGIDHTAIGISNTVRELAFYRDGLGFRVVGESENYGTEQERLNHVFSARLLITGIRADGGPGIEFLEYLSPRTGRPMPLDSGANDLWHWQTRLTTNDLDGIYRELHRHGARLVSPDVVELPDSTLGFRRGLTVRGPDGHAVQIVEK